MTGILGGLVGSLRKLGQIWSRGDFGATLRPYTAGAYAPLSAGKYFLFTAGNLDTGSTRNDYYYSNDGISWTAGTLPSNTGISAAAYNGTTLLIVSGYFSSVSDAAWTTTNGTTWTARDTGTASANRHTSAIWDGTRFLVTGTNGSANLRHSTDGATWAEINISGDMNDVAFNGTSTYIAQTHLATTGTKSGAYICTSNPTVATNWSSFTFPSSQRWSRTIFGNGVWIAFANNSTSYATSNNGTTWTARSLATGEEFGDSSNGASNRNKPLFHEGLFYYWSKGLKLFSSFDGITWTQVLPALSTGIVEIAAWAPGNGKIIGAGYDLAASNDGTRYYWLGQ